MVPDKLPPVVERFVRYCAVPSQSDPDRSAQVPSTPEQFDIARVVANDLETLGAEGVSVDEHAYVTAWVPASPGCESLPTLGLIAHIDTAWQANGSPVRPQMVRYEGGTLEIGHGQSVAPEDRPELLDLKGQLLVTSDGTSLLGGDDKAGVAEIVTLVERLRDDPALPHPRLALAFVPDEEIGHGAALLDLEAFGADAAYTLDAGPLGEVCWETFHAVQATVDVTGFSVHTGTAKGLLVNAAELLMELHRLLPPAERPEFTDDRDGFFYLVSMSGDCEHAHAVYILRDHERALVDRRMDDLRQAVAFINRRYGEGRATVAFVEQYPNMADGLAGREDLIQAVEGAFRDNGIEPFAIAMRGGTDGSQLTYRGLPCPNMSAGYLNAHGPCELAPVPWLEAMVDVLVSLVGRFAQDKESGR